MGLRKNPGSSERIFATRAGAEIRSAQITELFKRLGRRVLKLTQNFNLCC
jgi:hypothetical protein